MDDEQPDNKDQGYELTRDYLFELACLGLKEIHLQLDVEGFIFKIDVQRMDTIRKKPEDLH